MTNDRNDDEVLGRALARAIETQEPNETPYARSRIAVRPLRGGFPFAQFAGAAGMVLVVALAFGSWLTRPITNAPVAAPASATAAATANTTASAVATSGPQVEVPGTLVGPGPDSLWIYFTRDSLPPVGGYVHGRFGEDSALSHIATRLGSLQGSHDAVPSGAANPLSLVAPLQNGGSSFGVFPRVQGDVATVEFQIPTGWGVRGAAQTHALVQQLVYVITEEPGIRYARIVERGKQNAVIDGLVIDRALSREDVSGYDTAAVGDTITSGGADAKDLILTTSYSVDSVAPGLARFVVTATGPNGAARDLPSFSAWLDRAERDLGKVTLTLEVGAVPPTTTGLTVVQRSPLRAIRTVQGFGSPIAAGGTAFVLGLDDARPWRVFTMSNPARIVVDIGGVPSTVSDRLAVYAPTPGQTIFSGFEITGAARVFEANVAWRLRDSGQKVLTTGHFTASLGTSAVWGTFDTRLSFSGTGPPLTNITLELFEVSPKDGSEQGLVSIPLKNSP